VRAIPLLLPLLATLSLGATCIDPVRIPVGPRSIEPQCSYWAADIAAAGSIVAGAWMTSMTTGFGRPYTTGTTSGGLLDGRGHLRSAEHIRLNDAPGVPSIATNGTTSLLAWSRSDSGTFVQFLDASGALLGPRVRVSERGLSWRAPRAVWDGRDWIVVMEEGEAVVAMRLGADGSVIARGEIAAAATLGDAASGLVVVERNAGFEVVKLNGIEPVSRSPLTGIPAKAVVAIEAGILAWHGSTVGAVRLDANGLPVGPPMLLQANAQEPRRVAIARDGLESVVLWNDSGLLRGARIRADGTNQSLVPIEATLHGAATTSEGVIALASGSCSTVISLLLANGSLSLAPVEVVARATVPQTPHAIVPTARGQHVIWSEARPIEKGARLFVTPFDGNRARDPVELSDEGSIGEVDAAPLGAGSVVVWSEYANGMLPAVVKLARVDGSGAASPAVTIADPWYLGAVAVTIRGQAITVFTLEHATYAWIADLWRTDIAADGTMTRSMVVADIDGIRLDAATTAAGPVASWYDHDPPTNTLRLEVRDPAGSRVFPLPLEVALHRIVGGDEQTMVLWAASSDLHALFPETGLEVVVASPAGFHVEAQAGLGGAFDIAVAESGNETRIRLVNVTTTGVVTPRGEVCFSASATHLAMRGGTVDAILTTEDGRLSLARRPPARRRATAAGM
jgi:hypothetical protein